MSTPTGALKVFSGTLQWMDNSRQLLFFKCGIGESRTDLYGYFKPERNEIEVMSPHQYCSFHIHERIAFPEETAAVFAAMLSQGEIPVDDVPF